jgi:chromosome segregation protein
MDKGAHFYRCDFQVHTPSDRSWSGPRPTSDDDRRAFAMSLIGECRRQSLNAIAITDHHDLCFFPYIRQAAECETDDEGRELQPHTRITVFPALELTLGIPCQAILILDATFPLEFLTSLYTALGITQTAHSEATHDIPQRLDHVTTFDDICTKLDTIEYLKGRYILLPNVSERGNATLLRSGFAGHYKSMSCVGGYLDGAVEQLGHGNLGILSGKNRDYGFKSLGLYQTSDSRSADFSGSSG